MTPRLILAVLGLTVLFTLAVLVANWFARGKQDDDVYRDFTEGDWPHLPEDRSKGMRK